MKIRISFFLAFALSLYAVSSACPDQAPGRRLSFGVVGSPLSAVSEKGTTLAYELVIGNVGYPDGIFIEKIEISDADDPGVIVKTYEGDELGKHTCIPGNENGPYRALSAKGDPGKKVIADGGHIVLFVWVVLDKDKKVPSRLIHSVLARDPVSGQRVSDDDRAQPGAGISAAGEVIVRDPLLGGSWLCAGGVGPDSYNRTTIQVWEGKIYCPRRFGIDFFLVGDQGRYALGDLENNENYYCYGRKVFSVADGIVREVVDGHPDAKASPLGLMKDAGLSDGNYVIIEIGKGVYAFYGALKSGSIPWKVGAAIKAGEVVGNIGNSDSFGIPHLQFRVMDNPDPVRAQGLPFLIENFIVAGTSAGGPEIAGGIWKWVQDKERRAVVRTMPAQNQVIRFADYY